MPRVKSPPLQWRGGRGVRLTHTLNTTKMNSIGYFGPHTITWQLYREPFFLLGGVRALLLQVAHPAVAQGVAQYSRFQSDPFGRGYRTFAAMATIYFGDQQQADQTARLLQQIHSGIKGQYPQVSVPGGDASPVPFVATNPELLLWVFATIMDTSLQVYEWLPQGDLPADWREQFYEESKTAARLLGISDDVYPIDLQAFKIYIEQTLNSDLLGSTPACRAMAQAIVRHPKAPARLADLLAAGWLPAALCERLGITAGPDSAQRLAKLLRRSRHIYSLLPRTLRYNPAYHQACYRIARSNGTPPLGAGRFFHWLGKRMRLPLGLQPG
jgi:uncharacterized protein (DUF2236 family)